MPNNGCLERMVLIYIYWPALVAANFIHSSTDLLRIWLLLMCLHRPTSFQSLAQSIRGILIGICWLDNKSYCQWYTVCHFKHKSSLCGGATQRSTLFEWGIYHLPNHIPRLTLLSQKMPVNVPGIMHWLDHCPLIWESWILQLGFDWGFWVPFVPSDNPTLLI